MINLPIGGIALITVIIFFKDPQRDYSNLTLKQKVEKMDLLGALFFICGVACLLLALQWGGSTYAWSDSKVLGCLIGFALIIAVLIFLQFRYGDRYDVHHA